VEYVVEALKLRAQGKRSGNTLPEGGN
jgi:hypothetical protein